MTTSIERVERPTYEEFIATYYNKRKPVIITGYAEDWKALQWEPQYLKEKCGDVKVAVVSSRSQTTLSDPEKGWMTLKKEDMLFSSLIDLIATEDEKKRFYYLQQQELATFPELEGDYHFPSYVKDLSVKGALWVGSGRNITPLHYDTEDNFNVQIKGEKKFTLFEPKDGNANLYPFPFYSRNSTLSPVNMTNPNYEKYPKFKRAKPIEVVLRPGEMLYIPIFWWHQVETLSDRMTINTNFLWRPSLRMYMNSTGFKTLASMALGVR